MPHTLRLYKVAAKLLKLAVEEDKNVKNQLYNDKKYQFFNIKALYAVVTQALKHWDVLEILIKGSKILIKEPGLNVWHVRVIVTDLLFGQKSLDSDHSFVKKILKYEEKFKKLLSKDEAKKCIESEEKCETDIVAKVRYIKINTIKNDVNSVIEGFKSEDWEQLETANSYHGYLEQLGGLKRGSLVFLQDFHFPDILAFPPGTNLYQHKFYQDGSFFFMDKSSCLAPMLLSPHPDSQVLDMCAAPGLKTIQLASYVTSGKVYAVERHPNRYKILEQMIWQSGADNVITLHEDVTKLDFNQYKDVEYILLDPTCSGSGMRERQPLVTSEFHSFNKERLEKLGGFQLKLLRFALGRFPAAKRVVYSTCSLNVEENEEIVDSALNSLYHNFEVVSVHKKLPEWQSFGSADFHFGSKCIYSRPDVDFTNGFFVAVFERKKTQSDVHNSNSESQDEKNVSHIEWEKKRAYEENYLHENERTMVPHKRFKGKMFESKLNKEKTNILTDSDHNINHKEKLTARKVTISHKKRARQNKLKAQTSKVVKKEKNLRVKNKGGNNNDSCKSSKEDKHKANNCSEANHKIPKSKFRHKRMKLLKLKLESKQNNDSVKNSNQTSKLSNGSKTLGRHKEENKKLKKEKREISVQEIPEVEHNPLSENKTQSREHSVEMEVNGLSKKKKRKIPNREDLEEMKGNEINSKGKSKKHRHEATEDIGEGIKNSSQTSKLSNGSETLGRHKEENKKLKKEKREISAQEIPAVEHNPLSENKKQSREHSVEMEVNGLSKKKKRKIPNREDLEEMKENEINSKGKSKKHRHEATEDIGEGIKNSSQTSKLSNGSETLGRHKEENKKLKKKKREISVQEIPAVEHNPLSENKKRSREHSVEMEVNGLSKKKKRKIPNREDLEEMKGNEINSKGKSKKHRHEATEDIDEGIHGTSVDEKIHSVSDVYGEKTLHKKKNKKKHSTELYEDKTTEDSNKLSGESNNDQIKKIKENEEPSSKKRKKKHCF